jgi:hypothetical protein
VANSLFWVAEVTVPKYTQGAQPVTIPAKPHWKTAPARFGGCSLNTSCNQTLGVAYRICFENQDATIEIKTVPSYNAVSLLSGLYVFSVTGDVGPLNGGFSPLAWKPDYQLFWMKPPKSMEVYDSGSAKICSTDAAPTVDVCANNNQCKWSGPQLVCPPATGAVVYKQRSLSRVTQQMRTVPGRAYQCMYAVVSSSTGTNVQNVGLSVRTGPAQLGPNEAGRAPPLTLAPLTLAPLALAPLTVAPLACCLACYAAAWSCLLVSMVAHLVLHMRVDPASGHAPVAANLPAAIADNGVPVLGHRHQH